MSTINTDKTTKKRLADYNGDTLLSEWYPLVRQNDETLAEGINFNHGLVLTAQTTAETAQQTADTAQAAAETAQQTADEAVSAAAEALNTADNAQKAADTAQTAADYISAKFPNIKKNPDNTKGDIATSIIVGAGSINNTFLNASYCPNGDRNAGNFISGGYMEKSTSFKYHLSENPNTLSGDCVSSAIIGGYGNTAEYMVNVIIGGRNNYIKKTATFGSIIIGGLDNEIGTQGSGICQNSIIICGSNIKATGDHCIHSGQYNTLSHSSNTKFVIGNGTADDARSNCFRVESDGNVYGMNAFNSTGADYAEYFEWSDGNPYNEDRRGMFVTLDGDKIKIAGDGDEVIGVISATPSVIGNAYDDQWQGMYLTDVFGQPLTHMVHHEAEYAEVEVPDIDEEGNELETTHTKTICIHEEYDAEEYIINPEYDSTQEYIPRSQRKEWDSVGMFGQLIVTDDGSCAAGGYCTATDNGIAMAADTGFKVLKRLDENHVKILFK